MWKIAGTIVRALCFILSISVIIPKGLGDTASCTPDKVQITQSPTGRVISSRIEWVVDVTNTCTCNLSNVQLLCPNFESIKVGGDPTIITEIGNTGVCEFYKGRELIKSDTYRFYYIGDRINFAPYSFTIGRCYG
ncbi:hypothetical protein ACP275_05G091600 [Erythranthe tilingii]